MSSPRAEVCSIEVLNAIVKAVEAMSSRRGLSALHYCMTGADAHAPVSRLRRSYRALVAFGRRYLWAYASHP